MNANITHSALTITTFPHWQGVSIPRISYRYLLQAQIITISQLNEITISQVPSLLLHRY